MGCACGRTEKEDLKSATSAVQRAQLEQQMHNNQQRLQQPQANITSALPARKDDIQFSPHVVMSSANANGFSGSEISSYSALEDSSVHNEQPQTPPTSRERDIFIPMHTLLAAVEPSLPHSPLNESLKLQGEASPFIDIKSTMAHERVRVQVVSRNKLPELGSPQGNSNRNPLNEPATTTTTTTGAVEAEDMSLFPLVALRFNTVLNTASSNSMVDVITEEKVESKSNITPYQTTVLSTHDAITGVDVDGNKCINEYVIIGILGKGMYGEVKLAIDTKSDTPVAVKILKRPKTKKSLQDIQQEITIMKTVQHPNLVRLMNVINDDRLDKLFLVMEYMEGGILGVTPREPHPRSTSTYTAQFFSTIRTQFLDVVHGLTYLHEHNVVHMDIKPENILRTREGDCKLADFGLSRVFREHLADDPNHDLISSTQGTPFFNPPEKFSREPYHGKPADIWALGVTLYVVIFGISPFPIVSVEEFEIAVKTMDPLFPQGIHVPPLLEDLIRSMMQKDPTLRPTVKQVSCHPFFAGAHSSSTNGMNLEWAVKLWKKKKGGKRN